METRDYLNAYPVNAENVTRLQGYSKLIREGCWGPLIMDALKQIGVPYPAKGLQKLLSELYDGEGEQEGVPKGTKRRPVYPWKVSHKKILTFRTVPDNNLIGLTLLALMCQEARVQCPCGCGDICEVAAHGLPVQLLVGFRYIVPQEPSL